MSRASDLLAHLRPCPIHIDFLGTTYKIPAMDAVEWVALIDGQHPDLYEIFPVLAGGQAVAAVEDALWDEVVTREDVAEVSLQAIGAAADRPWWVAINIIRSAATAWQQVHVNDAMGKPLAGWLDEVWSKIMGHIDPAKRTAWITEVERAPKGTTQEIDFDAEEQAFLAAMNAVMK